MILKGIPRELCRNFALCLLTVTALLCQAKERPRDFTKSVDILYFRNSPDDVVKLRIPEGFIDRWVMGESIAGATNTIYLHGSGIDLLPEDRNNKNDFKYPYSRNAEITFGIQSLYRIKPHQMNERIEMLFQEQMKIRVKSCRYEDKDRNIYGMTLRSIDKKSCSSTVGPSRSDIYFRSDSSGAFRTVVRCSPSDVIEPEGPNFAGKARLVPRCEHSFALPELNSWVIVRYGRVHLPHWREIEKNAATRLLSFMSKN